MDSKLTPCPLKLFNSLGFANSVQLSWKAYLSLCKPKVVALIVFTAVIGMFLAVPGMPPWDKLIYGTLGIGLASASAAAINQYLDRLADAKMARTQDRPLPQGQLSPVKVMAFAGTLGVAGMAMLVWRVNTLTALLTFLSLIGYAVIYTVYLKRMTPQNIVIGGAAGAAPPVLGWCAVTGQVQPYALLLFLIIFVWTPPHFWALAIAKEKEYANAGIPMLPVTHGAEFTRLQIVLYTVLLLVTSLLPYITHMSGLIYLAGALPLGLIFLGYAVMLKRKPSNALAMKTFGYSIVYLMGIFVLLLVDHYL
ncbi:MAG: protoheme IX farnesyltransferase [Methylococcaceae bacterium]|nr:MAG: protoheme IX farnesyltransferase [Methylococcaceae bacterium]